MAVEISTLIAQAPFPFSIEAPGRPGAGVTRLVRARAGIALSGPGEGALVLIDPSAVDWSASAADARTALAGLRDSGTIGLIVLGRLELPTEIVNVFRQMKLFLASAPQLDPRESEAAAGLQDALQEILDRHAERERRQLTIVQQLLSAMNGDNPIAAVVEELSRQCEGSALLYDAAGVVVEATGSAPIHLIHSELDVRDLAAGIFGVGRWTVLGRELRIRAQSYLLALATRSPRVLEEDGQFILDSVARLLGSFEALDSFAAVQQAQTSGQLLREIELGVPPGKERQYWDRMSQFGFSPFSQLRYVVATAGQGRGLGKAELDSITSFVARKDAPTLVSESIRAPELEPGVRMIAEATPALDEWLEGFDGTLAVGVSQPYSQLSTTPEEAQAAQTAEGLARRNLNVTGEGASTVVFVDRLAPADWLLARARSVRDRAHIEKYAAPLREHEELLRTMLVYFCEGLRIVKAARALGIHQNTLRYRLGKIESILNVRLGDPATIANLYLALREELGEH